MDCKTEKVDLGKRNVSVRELSPREIDAWLSPTFKGQEYSSVVDHLYGEQLLTGDVILLATDLTPEDLLDIPPHDMEKVVAKIKSLNPFFVRMLDRFDSQLKKAASN